MANHHVPFRTAEWDNSEPAQAGLPTTPPQSGSPDCGTRRKPGRHKARQASTTIHPSPANTRRGGTTVQRPFKSHETCPHRPRCGQTPWSQRPEQPLSGPPRIDPTGPLRARPSDMPSLYDDSERARRTPKGDPAAKPFFPFRMCFPSASTPRELVEPDGIEPTTSCLQSTRSPN
jgi:hypothetical protein